ncbi:Uncharacterised protein [Mycobacteroides abscessus subsp. abscessus]|nr:Uncharacterised protein [Mycobacteroides abscessus subsp. abscessus]
MNCAALPSGDIISLTPFLKSSLSKASGGR